MRVRDNGILGDSRCPHCSHPWVPVPSRGQLACSVCLTPTADGDMCDRWHGTPAVPAKAETLLTVPDRYRLAA